MRALLVTLACCTSCACLLRRPLPDPPPLASTHETRRRSRADGSLESEVVLLVSPDGRVVRDGSEREFHPDGRLAAERFFARGVPTGVWRSWFADGRARSETDFGPPGSQDLRTSRFWHAGGQLAAEGTLRAGVREGEWDYYSPQGGRSSTGAYREGLRDGRWVFYDPRGRKQAEGCYSRGERVGRWTLWDEHGEPHERASEAPDGGRPVPDLFHHGR